jgi:N-formylglutamate deformylase
MIPFFVTVPHSGEKVPKEAYWLAGLPETVLMCDVDRYVHELYSPATETLGLTSVVAETHRYVVDLNRVPEDVDQDSVEESKNPSGKFTIGFHWSQTTTGARLMKNPIPVKLHNELTHKYFEPFHQQVQKTFAEFKAKGFKKVYHLDAHSMPSKGTDAHRDPGSERPQIVVSDRDGVSCEASFKDLVIKAYESVGFQVAYNWPYKGGRITETYGKPDFGQHTLQVEMNRSLYMDEITKKKSTTNFEDVQKRVTRALATILSGLQK